MTYICAISINSAWHTTSTNSVIYTISTNSAHSISTLSAIHLVLTVSHNQCQHITILISFIVITGDIGNITMQEVPQNHFIPLPEILCLIILDLNNKQILATVDIIQAQLKKCYQGTQLPSNQLVYETLHNLIQERKLFHTGMYRELLFIFRYKYMYTSY